MSSEQAGQLYGGMNPAPLCDDYALCLSKRDQVFEIHIYRCSATSRIAELEDILANCTVIEEHESDPNTVRVGSKITVADVETGDEETYQVVGSQEADPMNGRISEESPFGKALLGKAIGEIAVVEAPVGNIEYKVVAIQR